MRTKKSTSWMEDGDDARFVPLKRQHAKGRRGASPKGHPAEKMAKKEVPAKRSFENIYQPPKAARKKTSRKRVAGK